jgi:membrane associated rhomboid family serine protease
MIPIKDNTRSRAKPFVNYLLILSCGATFVYQIWLGPGFESFVWRFGVVPADVTAVTRGQGTLDRLVPLLTSMFLHGGWVHLIGNMLYLYIFGDAVEGRIGHRRYLVFYLLCGVGAAVIQLLSNPTSMIPMVGASGAIAGVLGAYLILFPKARVLTLIPLIIFFPTLEIPAFVFLGLWFVLQFLQGVLSGTADQGGVAWWAHAGGFVVGGLLLPLFLLGKKR